MLTLYIANKNYSSWSLRPWLLMKALDIPFVENVVLFDGNRNPNNFGRYSPSRKFPVLVENGIHVWDSLAITEFLAETYQTVWPTEKENRAWARSACAEMHSGFQALRSECPMSIGVRLRLYGKSSALISDIERIERLWEDGLARFNGPWLAGDKFSAADAFFGPVAFRCRTYDIALNKMSKEYVEQLLKHPGMLQWEQEALAETQRDEAHDYDVRVAGALVNDFRAMK
jgi:glutathione S-transferase